MQRRHFHSSHPHTVQHPGALEHAAVEAMVKSLADALEAPLAAQQKLHCRDSKLPSTATKHKLRNLQLRQTVAKQDLPRPSFSR